MPHARLGELSEGSLRTFSGSGDCGGSAAVAVTAADVSRGLCTILGPSAK